MNRDDVVGAQLRDNRFMGIQGSQIVRGQTPNPGSYNTAGAVTYTVNDILSGIIVRNPNGAARSDVLPTAALLVAAIPRVQVGDVIRCMITNTSGGAIDIEQLTLTAGAGGSWDANQTAPSRVIRTYTWKEIAIRFTNVTPGTEAYVVYA